MLPLQCAFPGLEGQILFVMLAPLGIAAVAAAIGALLAGTTRDDKKKKLGMMASLLLPSLPFVLVWSFLIFPPVSSLGFRALAPCECFQYDISPPGEETEVCFLSTDHSVVCQDLGGVQRAPMSIIGAAISTVVIYALLVPAMYCYLLFIARGSLSRRQAATPLSSALGFLVRGYSNGLFWWELVSVARKLLLTGFLALIAPRSVLQLFIATIVALCFLALEIYVTPFARAADNFLSLVANLALVLTLQGSLGFKLAQLNLSDGYITSSAMLGVLIASAAFVLLVALLVLLSGLAAARRTIVARHVNTNLPVTPRPLDDGEFHALISHQWGSGQDQANSIKARLQGLAPGLRCFLDVEDLADTSRLEEYVEASDVLIVFLSGSIDTQWASQSPTQASPGQSTIEVEVRSDYMRSKSCLRELRAATRVGKPICWVAETDPRHGGVPLEVHRRDCPADLRDLLAEHPLIPWFRAAAFQQISLRQILQRVLGHMTGEVYILGEVLREPWRLMPPPEPATYHLYILAGNHGAAEAAALLATEASRAGGCALQTTSQPELRADAMCTLLYLNDGTAASWVTIQEEVEAALLADQPLLLLHECRNARGAVSFDAIIERTPLRLRQLGVFNTAAQPLHESLPGITLISSSPGSRPSARHAVTNEHLAVSCRLALRAACGSNDMPANAHPSNLPRQSSILLSSTAEPWGPRGLLRSAAASISSAVSLRVRSRRATIEDDDRLRLEGRELVSLTPVQERSQDSATSSVPTPGKGPLETSWRDEALHYPSFGNMKGAPPLVLRPPSREPTPPRISTPPSQTRI